MYTNSFFLDTSQTVLFIFFVEDDPRFRATLPEITMSNDNNAFSALDGKMMLLMDETFMIHLDEITIEMLTLRKKAAIAVNIFGEKEIRILQYVQVPDIFIGQIIAYSHM